MPNLQGTVGIGGNNAAHDTSLVQVMLRVVKTAKGASYFAADYTGTYGDSTKNAIIAFQKDKGLLPPETKTPAAKPDPAAAKNNETSGLIGPNTKTYQTLVASLPPAYADIRAMPNLKTIYVEGPQADATTSTGQVSGKAGLLQAFRGNLGQLITNFHNTHKIALWVVPGSGWNRTFEQQADIMRSGAGKTKAGPGESNHNWGNAVDLGFNGFKWLKGDTSVVVDDYWLHKLEAAKPAEPATLWSTRNAVATGLGLHKSELKGDLIHIQNFSDVGVSMTRSLAAQLQRVGKFKWARDGEYQTDMGTGAKLEAVGTAMQLWTKVSHPSKALVTVWKNAQEKAAWAKLGQPAKDALNKAAGIAAKLPPGAKIPPELGLKTWKEADVTPALLDTAKAALRTEMETAEAKRDQWKAVP